MDSNLKKVGLVVGVLVLTIPIFLKYKDQRKFNNRTTSEEVIKNIRMDNNIIIITGANSGIGKYTSKILVQNGAHVILGCRNSKKAENAKQSIISDLKANMNGNEWRAIANKLHYMHLDLNSLASIKAFATAFEDQYSSLNILINNAGVMALPHLQFTADGYEKQFAINHLGHFYLTMLLTPIMQRTNGIKRVINVASIANNNAPDPITHWLRFGNLDRYLHNTKEYEFWRNYGFSKACNILFAKEYNHRFSNSNIYAFSLHPGVIVTQITRHLPSIFVWIWLNILSILWPITKTTSQGSATTVFCATMNETEVKLFGGHYFVDCNEANSNLKLQLLNGNNARLLWGFSNQLLAEKGFQYEHQ